MCLISDKALSQGTASGASQTSMQLPKGSALRWQAAHHCVANRLPPDCSCRLKST